MIKHFGLREVHLRQLRIYERAISAVLRMTTPALLTNSLLNRQHPLLVPLRHETDRHTGPARTRRPAHAMRVLLWLARQVPIHDHRDVRDIESASADVR